MIAKLDEVLSFILNISSLYHFSYNWNLNHVISQKTYGQVFHSNKHKCVEKKYFVEKITSIWKIIQIMLEPFVLKSILYVYQNAKRNQIKTTPK